MTAAAAVRAVRDWLAPVARRWGLAPVARRRSTPEAAAAADRTALLRSMLPLPGHGLEIGPGYNPLLPKAEGFDVETADYTDAAGLRMKYRDNPHVDPGRIEDVDHVLEIGRSLAEAV